MYSHLTINHCLFAISEQHLASFKKIASSHQLEGNFDNLLALGYQDSLTTVLQVWCVLNEDKLKLVYEPDKMMPYACNYYILNLIRGSKKISSFIKLKNAHPDIVYIVSYYLTIVTLQWSSELMREYNLNPYLGTIVQPKNYYLFFEEEQLVSNSSHDFYMLQKKWSNLMATDYTHTNRFHSYINKAIKLTNNYLINR